MSTATATANENFAMETEGSAGAAALVMRGKGRINSWALLALFSTLSLIAHATDDMNLGKGENTWITIATALSLIVAALATLAHTGKVGVIGDLFAGTLVEGVTSLIMVGLWAGALPVIMDPGKGLAQMYVGKSSEDSASSDYQAVISNANLFFAGWGAGVCALVLLARYVRDQLVGGGGIGIVYTSKWYLLMLASVIVVIESARFKKQVCGIEGGTEAVTCSRNMYGLITGIVGLVVSFLISLLSSLGRDSALLTTVAACLLAVLYTICAGLVTFENGPATYVGNHYFAAWAGFFVAFAMCGTVLKEFLGVGAGSPAAAGEDGNAADNI